MKEQTSTAPHKAMPEARPFSSRFPFWKPLKHRLLGSLFPNLSKSTLNQKRLLIELISWSIVFFIFLITPLPHWVGGVLSGVGESVSSVAGILGTLFLSLLLIGIWSIRCWLELGRTRHLSETDPLTGLYNRRVLRDMLAAEIARIKRHPRPLSLIMFDVDDFKRVNDSFGHAAGDELLKDLASMVRKTLRNQDCVARWGGDEFVIVTPETDLLGSYQLAERLRHRLAKQKFGEAGQVTASFGVCRVQYQDDVDSFLHRVDRLLYLAKDRGKNVVQTEPISLVARATVPERTQLLA